MAIGDTRKHNRIDLSVSGRYEEGRAAGAISPGALIEKNSAGTYVVQADDGGLAEGNECLVASIDALQGKTMDDAYASGDLVPFFIPKAGDVVALRLKDAENITEDDYLTSDGTGQVRLAVAAQSPIEGNLFVAMETLDLTGNGTFEFIKARKV